MNAKLLDKDLSYALLGVTADNTQHSFWVLMEMLRQGYTVKPVAANITNIAEVLVYPDIKSCMPDVDVILFCFSDASQLYSYGYKTLIEIHGLGIYQVIFDLNSINLSMRNFALSHAFDFAVTDIFQSFRQGRLISEEDSFIAALDTETEHG